MCEENFELFCESCGRVEELPAIAFDRARASTPAMRSAAHLFKILKKHKILDALNTIRSNNWEERDPARFQFLANLIHNFSVDGRSVNYICFLHDYFEAVPFETWPLKEVILERLLPVFEKIHKATPERTKERFDKWWITLR